MLYCLLVRSSVFWALMRSLCCFASHVLSCVWQMASVPWVHPGSWLEESACFSIIYLLNIFLSRPWAARLSQLCAAINKIGRCHRQAHHLTGAAQGREGRRADWQHEPGRSKRTSPAQAANRPDASRNRHHPTLSPTTPAFAARPISRLLLPMRKRARLPPVHAWLPPHGARTRLSATGTRRAKGPNLGPILFPVLPWPTTCSSTKEKQSRHEPAGGLLSSSRSAASERRADREVPAGVRESGDADCFFFRSGEFG